MGQEGDLGMGRPDERTPEEKALDAISGLCPCGHPWEGHYPSNSDSEGIPLDLRSGRCFIIIKVGDPSPMSPDIFCKCRRLRPIGWFPP